MPIRGKQGPLSKGVSSAIGFATEAYTHHQESKDAKKPSQQFANPDPPSSSSSAPIDSDSSDDHDEEDWIRDETESQLQTNGQETLMYEPEQSIDSIIDDFTRSHPPPPYFENASRLPCPVIIPQRRPGTRSRGFVRAYAPVLGTCGIDQATFMDFHEGFHRATHKQGWFHAVNIAIAISVLAETAAIAPSVIVHVTAFLVHTSIEAGRRLYNSKETNKFLDTMNNDLFRPHGLYAMIMCYKPASSQASEVVDLNDATNQAVASRAGGDGAKFRTTSGKTTGIAELPAAAPLIFPYLQAAPEAEKINAFKRAANFAADYSDRRAQASFEAQNPGTSQLNVAPRKEFASRWADPNHPVNKGGLVTVLTGGVISPEARLQQRREHRNNRRGREGLLEERKQSKKSNESKSLLGQAKRKLHEGVLYLMVVNMPSEEELRLAQDLLEKSRHGGLSATFGKVIGR